MTPIPFPGVNPILCVELRAAKIIKQSFGTSIATLSETYPICFDLIVTVSLAAKSNAAAPGVLNSGIGKLLSNRFILTVFLFSTSTPIRTLYQKYLRAQVGLLKPGFFRFGFSAKPLLAPVQLHIGFFVMPAAGIMIKLPQPVRSLIALNIALRIF